MTTLRPPDSAPQVSRRRGPYAKSAQTRAAILDAALEVFAQFGYRAGSLKQIAERVGVSEPALLHHFTSKTELLQSVLDERDRKARGVAAIDQGSGADVLRGLLALTEHNAQVPGVVRLYCTLAAEATSPAHPAHDYFADRYVRTRAHLRRAFGDLHEEGCLHDGVDPSWAADATIALMDGLQQQWLLDPGSLNMVDRLRQFFRITTRISV